jgi:hypothetical protein
VYDDFTIVHTECANGCYDMNMIDDIHINEEKEELMNVCCPMCKGTKVSEQYSDKLERFIDITCPLCNGKNVYQTKVYYYIDKWIEVEDTKPVKPYNEMYEHKGDSIEIQLNVGYIREERMKYES